MDLQASDFVSPETNRVKQLQMTIKLKLKNEVKELSYIICKLQINGKYFRFFRGMCVAEFIPFSSYFQ